MKHQALGLLPALLLFTATLAFAQADNRVQREDNSQITSFELERDVWENLGEEAREDEEHVRKHPDAEIVPAGWLDDYDYVTPFPQYLAAHVAAAAEAGQRIHLYLYADWLEPCREFRRTVVAREDYAELFADHQVIMVDYGYFAETFDMKFRNLPVLIEVHTDGKIGPEIVHPLSRRAEHPAKAFNRVKKYLLADS
ncbi:MAG: hypothetical protein HKN58_00490 [Xanthomonadales bacterium]|nr:hypothetical protein [Xanthomonadales bacterium]